MSKETHQKRILLVEDQDQFYEPIQRWLEDEGYVVTLAKTYEAALTAVRSTHFHVVIVDLHLDNDNLQKDEGMALLYQLHDEKLNQIVPAIMLTAYGNKRVAVEAFQKLGIFRFLDKEPGFRKELLEAVQEAFAERVKINFDLEYDANSADMVAAIAEDVNWSMSSKPNVDLLSEQVRDLFGKLFSQARRVHIRKLKPGLTGAAVMRIQPTWNEGLGPSYVAKIGRADKVQTEAERYETYVSHFLPPNTISQVKDVAYTRHVGALLYTFAQNDMIPNKEFDEFYHEKDAQTIVDSLRNLFETTCRYWFEAREPRQYEDLRQLYYQAFQLTREKLVQRIQVVLPDYDPEATLLQFERVALQTLNPLAWLEQHKDECEMAIYHCITHGDLTGRNIMVDQTNKCWLIDFYRTYYSHIMRDFVILETDIKYRLMETPDVAQFMRLEELLLSMDKNGALPEDGLRRLPPHMRKAAEVVAMLRTTAVTFATGGISTQQAAARKEHLLSLLMTTLNVARLRHIAEERKLQALLSASLICAELDKIAGRRPQYPELVTAVQETVTLAPEPSSTAQQRFLAQALLGDHLMLFLGSNRAAVGFEWPLSLSLLPNLPWQAIYTTNQQPQLEQTYAHSKRPFALVTAVNGQIPEKMPIYKLYGNQSDAPASGAGYVMPRSQQFLQQVRLRLQQGHYLLIICASESELLMIHEACYTGSEEGLMWVAGADLSEDRQDDFRGQGFRVLPDTPHDLLTTMQELI